MCGAHYRTRPCFLVSKATTHTCFCLPSISPFLYLLPLVQTQAQTPAAVKSHDLHHFFYYRSSPVSFPPTVPTTSYKVPKKSEREDFCGRGHAFTNSPQLNGSSSKLRGPREFVRVCLHVNAGLCVCMGGEKPGLESYLCLLFWK